VIAAPEIGHKGDAPAPVRAPFWQTVTMAEINRVDFGSLPPDSGIVSPIARPGLDPPQDMAEQLSALEAALPAWLPAHVADPVQRARNLLYVAAVPDILEAEILESYVPLVVFEKLKQEIPKDDLIRILYWIAMHPAEGEDRAARQLRPLGLGDAPADMEAVRERVTFYSLKLLGRLIGKIPVK
jgi:hypothetical protein